MKRAMIIFIVLFVLTAIIPFAAVIKNKNENKQQELVNMFSSRVTPCYCLFSEYEPQPRLEPIRS